MSEDRAAAPVEGQLYYHPEGAALFVRVEDGDTAVLALTRGGVVFTRRVPLADLGVKYKPEFTPAMNDTERGRLVAERAALADALADVEAVVFELAGGDLASRTALAADVIAAVRERYRQRLKEAE